jgi:hypothetical protein
MRKEEEDYTMAKKEKNNCTRVFSYENGRCHQDCYIYFIRSGFWVFFLLTIAANGKKDGDDVKGGGKVDSFSPHERHELFRDKKVSGELVGGEREQLAQVNMGNGM